MPNHYDLIIKGGEVVLPHETKKMDIGVTAGVITALSECIQGECDQVIHASHLYILPGMIDIHVHFDEPGLGDWEGFYHGSSAMAAGGCTTYFDMPLNGVPPTIRVSALQQKLEAAKDQSVVDYALWGGLVPGNEAELSALAEAGVIGFKAFMSSPAATEEDEFREVDDLTLYRGMIEIAKHNKILALHAESNAITSKLAEQKLAAGLYSAADYVESRPVIAEMEAVQRALFFAEQTGCAVHFVHISSPQTVEMIDNAKKRGMNVTLETCPHYLVLTSDDLDKFGGFAKCSPPLRIREEQDLLWKLLEEDKIDMISSDHSPCPSSLKENADNNFFAMWGGISGGQSSLEIMLDEGFNKRGVPLPQIAQWLSTNPAKRFGLYPNKGEIKVGSDADFAIVDLNQVYTLEQEDLYYKHPHSVYLGREIGCRVQMTISRGMIVYRVKQGVNNSTAGRWLGNEE